MIRVFLCGAHSTGKTTLLHDVGKEMPDIKEESEIARRVLDEMSSEERRKVIDYKNHPKDFENLQRLILKRQCEVERENANNGEDYIADRGIDPIVYAALYLGDDVKNTLLALPTTQECIQSLYVAVPWKNHVSNFFKAEKVDDFGILPVARIPSGSFVCVIEYKTSFVFVIHPHKQCMKEDGERIMPVFSELTRFTELLIQILDDLGIGYIPITVLDRSERCSIVVDHIRQRQEFQYPV